MADNNKNTPPKYDTLYSEKPEEVFSRLWHSYGLPYVAGGEKNTKIATGFLQGSDISSLASGVVALLEKGGFNKDNIENPLAFLADKVLLKALADSSLGRYGTGYGKTRQ